MCMLQTHSLKWVIYISHSSSWRQTQTSDVRRRRPLPQASASWFLYSITNTVTDDTNRNKEQKDSPVCLNLDKVTRRLVVSLHPHTCQCSSVYALILKFQKRLEQKNKTINQAGNRNNTVFKTMISNVQTYTVKMSVLHTYVQNHLSCEWNV